ncbi:MAG: alanine racemase [Ilumatobacteraceae bacterium]|nr:alanine racemase [Acidimicrobiales bacterium]MCB9394700.1 alanine racemase [Acidimicrobiaceae bacterium]
MRVQDLSTPAVVVDVDVLDANLRTMAAVHPGPALRPHVKAHKCTALAAAQAAIGHRSFTCATVREVVGMAAAGLGHDLLLANEVVDAGRLRSMVDAAVRHDARVTVAVDSVATIEAAAAAGVTEVLVDVDVGLPRCGCAVADAGHVADLARARGLQVRGVMGYEGHLMALDDPVAQRDRVDEAMALLVAAHADVGGDVISAGGTGTHHLHRTVGHPGGAPGVTEVQAGSYALMDSHYAARGHPFGLACHVLGTVVSVSSRHAVADVGLKAMGMDHGNPTTGAGAVWFLSDEHVTFAPTRPVAVGERVAFVPAHIDPTLAMHEAIWLVRGDEVLDRWPIDLRHW